MHRKINGYTNSNRHSYGLQDVEFPPAKDQGADSDRDYANYCEDGV